MNATTIDLGQIMPLFQGDWKPSITYHNGDFVVHDSHLWEFVKDEPAAGDEPVLPDGAAEDDYESVSKNWVRYFFVGSKGETGEDGYNGVVINIDKIGRGPTGKTGPIRSHQWVVENKWDTPDKTENGLHYTTASHVFLRWAKDGYEDFELPVISQEDLRKLMAGEPVSEKLQEYITEELKKYIDKNGRFMGAEATYLDSDGWNTFEQLHDKQTGDKGPEGVLINATDEEIEAAKLEARGEKGVIGTMDIKQNGVTVVPNSQMADASVTNNKTYTIYAEGTANEYDQNVNTVSLVLPRGIEGPDSPYAKTAERLTTPRTISVTGAATGTSNKGFDGTSNVNIVLSSVDSTKLAGTTSLPITANAATATTTPTVVGNATLNNTSLKYTANGATLNLLTPSNASGTGASLRVGANAATIVSAGEIGDSIYNNTDAKNTENLYLGADYNIHVFSNGQSGAKSITFNPNGDLGVANRLSASKIALKSGATGTLTASSAGTVTGNSATATRLQYARTLSRRFLYTSQYTGSNGATKTRTMCAYAAAAFNGSSDVVLASSGVCVADSCPSDSCSYCAYSSDSDSTAGDGDMCTDADFDGSDDF